MSADLITSLRALAAARHDDLSLAADAVIEIERQRAEIERLTSELKKARTEVENLYDQVHRWVDDRAKAQLQADRLRDQSYELQRQRDEARAEVRRMRELLVTIQRLNSERDVALSRERDEALAEVERLMRDAKSLEGIIDTLERRIDGPDGLLAKVERLSRERDEARAALKPFASLFLWPDDLDSSSAADIRAEEDWNEAENDARSDDLWVRRGDIRAARKAVKAE